MLELDVAPGVHRIEDAYTNWYLVEDEGRLTVVDAGVPKSWSSLVDALRALGRQVSDVEALVLTHGHFDHVGFAERARTQLGVPVWIHERDVPLTRHPSRFKHARSRLPYLVRPKSMPVQLSLVASRAFFVKPVKEVRTFTGGTLAVPGSPHVVFTPGHTFGHCAFHLPDRGVLLTGDALVTLDPYTGDRGPRLVARAVTAHVAQALDSLSVLAETDARVVLTGHGEPWRDGVAAAVERARAAGSA